MGLHFWAVIYLIKDDGISRCDRRLFQAPIAIDDITKCHDIFVFAVDSGAVRGAWIDCKHKNITNEALFIALYTRFLMKSVVIIYPNGLRRN